MPEGDKGEDAQGGGYDVVAATERDVDVSAASCQRQFPNSGARHSPHDPKIVASMPTAPKPQRRVIVGHAANHVFGRVDAIQQSPETEESPWNEKLPEEGSAKVFGPTRSLASP